MWALFSALACREQSSVPGTWQVLGRERDAGPLRVGQYIPTAPMQLPPPPRRSPHSRGDESVLSPSRNIIVDKVAGSPFLHLLPVADNCSVHQGRGDGWSLPWMLVRQALAGTAACLAGCLLGFGFLGLGLLGLGCLLGREHADLTGLGCAGVDALLLRAPGSLHCIGGICAAIIMVASSLLPAGHLPLTWLLPPQAGKLPREAAVERKESSPNTNRHVSSLSACSEVDCM